ncbi:hypothetical protein [Actinomyces sp. zg328]|uniref:hypothetical protein n=1 Tax=Actinomyces sp. zg328 TaxID=2609287 RepID=UPI00135B294B|nr:hypothetical protein [Actinomyces sp. zg328]
MDPRQLDAEADAPHEDLPASAASGEEAGTGDVAPLPPMDDAAAWADTPSQAPTSFADPVPRAAYPGFPAPSAHSAPSAHMVPTPYQQVLPYQPQPAAEPAPLPQEQWSSQRGLLVVVIILLLVIAAGGGVWYGTTRHGDDAAGASAVAADGAPQGSLAPAQGSQPASVEGSVTMGSTIEACGTAPSLTPTSVTESNGELQVSVRAASSCADGDFLAGSVDRLYVKAPSGQGGADDVVANGRFDFSANPFFIPSSGRTLTLRFGAGHYFRSAGDLSASTISVGAEPDRSAGSSLPAQGVGSGVVSALALPETHPADNALEDAAASSALRWQKTHDKTTVTSTLKGKWTPQLSSKRAGLVAEGKTWDSRATLEEFQATRRGVPTAVLINSDEWPVFDAGGGWWVTLAGVAYDTPEQANAWCDAQGLDRDHCFAKKIDTTGTPDGTTKLR